MLNHKRLLVQDMARKVTSDIMDYLRQDMPLRTRLQRCYGYEFSVHIRAGLITLLDINCWTEDNELCTIETAADIDMQLQTAEKWLLESLGRRLNQRFYGSVTIALGARNDALTFRKTIHQQQRYDWDMFSKNVDA